MLIAYMNTQWMNNKPFTPVMWNVFYRERRLRTTNTCEGWNSRWNRRIGRNAPSLWTVVRELKNEEILATQALVEYARGTAPPQQRRKWRQIDDRLAALKVSLMDNRRTTNNYWTAVGIVSRGL